MEIRGNVCVLTPTELMRATIGAMQDENDHDLFLFLNAKENALYHDLEEADSSLDDQFTDDEWIDDDCDDYTKSAGQVDEALADEALGSTVGLIEILFGDASLVDSIARCIAVGKTLDEDAQVLIERIIWPNPNPSASQMRLLERNQRREQFSGRPPYLHVVPSEEE
jgi:hypothetical protein